MGFSIDKASRPYKITTKFFVVILMLFNPSQRRSQDLISGRAQQ